MISMQYVGEFYCRLHQAQPRAMQEFYITSLDFYVFYQHYLAEQKKYYWSSN